MCTPARCADLGTGIPRSSRPRFGDDASGPILSTTMRFTNHYRLHSVRQLARRCTVATSPTFLILQVCVRLDFGRVQAWLQFEIIPTPRIQVHKTDLDCRIDFVNSR